MLRSNFVYNPALKCMRYNGEVLEITISGLAKWLNPKLNRITNF